MLMKKQAIILAALLAATAAQADQKSHAYVGVAAGLSHIGIDCTGATSCDKTDTGGKLVGGYSFGNGFGLEAGYISFGKGRGADAISSAELKPTALMLGGAFALPLGSEWGFNFRLGAARVKTKVDATFGTARATESQTRTKAYAGVGLTYAISQAVTLELAVDSTQGQLNDEKGTLRLVSVGASFAF
jgi:OmpA-OmpF porin, OOP family